MRLDRRKVYHNMHLTEIELLQFHNYCKVIANTLKHVGEVVQVWYNHSLSSEAVYFTIKLQDGRMIFFSIRNHTSRAVKRQHNFFLSDYDRLVDLRDIVTEWVEKEIQRTGE